MWGKGITKIKFILNNLLTSTFCIFSGGSSFISIDLSSFNTKNVINMNGIVSGCSSLKSFDLSSFNPNNGKKMKKIFSACTSLKSVNLSLFNALNVINISAMFQEIIKINIADNFSTLLGLFSLIFSCKFNWAN